MRKKYPEWCGTSATPDHLSLDRSVPNSVRESPKLLPAVFYKNKLGAEPVRKWLKDKAFSNNDRLIIGTNIKKVEIGWPIGMPTCRPLTKGLWEVRTDLPNNRIVRVIFSAFRGKMVLLHGFIKKNEETPQSDIDIAIKRKREVES